MRIVRADVLGMCFGVRDALEILANVNDPSSVTIHGEFVHNELVLVELNSAGFHSVAESKHETMPKTDLVLITAHGISERERARLESAGKRLIDTTCPLVNRAHEAAICLRDEGRHVLLIGKRDHVEVRGLVGDLTNFDIIESTDQVRTYSSQRLGIISQTTMKVREVDGIRSAILKRNHCADIRFIDTVCRPTKEHQQSLDRLIDKVDAVVVVGGRNSNNTRALASEAQNRGLPAIHIQEAGELSFDWFQPDWTVGLTAGTSTLDETINEVHNALVAMAERFNLVESHI